jgi:hypothetical protein
MLQIEQNIKEWITKATAMAVKNVSVNDRNRKMNYLKSKNK